MLDEFLTYLKNVDVFILNKINHEWVNSFTNWFFPTITDWQRKPEFLYMFLPVACILILWRLRIRGAKIILLVALAVACSDLISYRILKEFITRPRPAHAGINVELRVPDQVGNSFPSNHAANIFAAAMMISLCLPGWSPLVLFYAICVAYSRPYVGVHYPSDVIGGAILGIAVSQAIWYVTKTFLGKDLGENAAR